MRKQFLSLIVLTLLCHAANAQNMDPGLYYSRINDLFLKEYDYMKPLDSLQASQSTLNNDAALRNAYYQLSATYRSFIGDYATALKDYNAMYPPRSLHPDTVAKRKQAFAGFHAEDAVTKILSLTATRRVVMINEAHHISYHRLFTKSLLQQLYQQGFRYLALETLAYHDDALNKRKYPVQGDGFYSAEPLFGDLIRTAIRLGFRVVAYEDTTDCSGPDCNKQREITEAQNLINILRKDPTAKILVHAGYDHIMKQPPNGFKRMAMYFAEMSGIDPLTINQEKMCEQDTITNESPYYVAAQQLFRMDRPSVIVKQDSVWVEPRFAGYFDVQVFHPRFKTNAGRPGYFKLDPSRIAKALTPEAMFKNRLVQAYFKGEEKDGIPVDQLWYDGKGPLYLMLPQGEFEIVVGEDKQNTLSIRQER